MQNSKEQVEILLKPRYRVLIDYPGSYHIVGQIIHYDYGAINPKYYDRFPDVFQKLYWYEERTVDEMPKFVKMKNEIFEVSKWGEFLGSMFPSHKQKNGSQPVRPAWQFNKQDSKPVFIEQ